MEEFEPFQLKDADGETHLFHFETRDFGGGVAAEAYETAGGYRFQVIGPAGSDRLGLVGQLIQKIRRALEVKHLRHGEFGIEIADRVVRGRLEWDEDEDGRAPLVVVDGQAMSWGEFGKLLMAFEGWQFKLEVRDLSDEL